MRKALDLIYRGSGILAAVFLAAICLIVLAQVVANIIDAVAGWLTGSPIGLVIPSYAEFAGFFLAASSFLALAYALRAGARAPKLGTPPRAGAEMADEQVDADVGAGAVMAGYFAWYTVVLTAESLRYNDLSPGMIPVPLWIPQTAMAAGLIVLTIALVDSFVEVLRERTPSYGDGDGG